jgi:hypothetical protein
MLFYHFDMVILKIKTNNYFDIFLIEKYFWKEYYTTILHILSKKKKKLIDLDFIGFCNFIFLTIAD